jgi:endonuclease YncB( thermonuclease family)
LSILLPIALVGCLGTKRGDGEDDGGPDGSTGDSGTTPPDGDVFIPEGCIAVSRVIDGDTFAYVNPQGEEIRVRLLGINTPERGEACHETGRNALSSLIGGRIIRIDGDDNADNVDIYDRELRYVSLCGSTDIGEINLQMVEGGWACVFDAFVDGLMLEAALRAAERDAASAQAGCWEDNSRFCN